MQFTAYPLPPSDLPPAPALREPDARVERVPEAVLQDLWRRLAFDRRGLTTTDGQPVHILDPGSLNPDGGPDFSAANIRLGGIEWHGDVEVHRTSGDWLWHRHHEDAAYDRVVLHVVLAADRHTGRLRRRDGSPLPEVVLLPRLQESLRALLYRFFTRPGQPFACAGMWGEVPDPVRRPWLRLLGQERLGTRADPAGGEGTPPEEALYRAVARALGHAPNADAMEALARRVPLARLRALGSRADAEALLLGAAGLIPPPSAVPPGDPSTAAYVAALRERFGRLEPSLKAPPLPPLLWQHARLRPANAPARRIAQAAALVSPGGLLAGDPFPPLRDAARGPSPLPALTDLLRAEPDPYWRTHLRPELRCREGSARVGRQRAQTLLLDAVLPALLQHAVSVGDEPLAEHVAALVSALPAPSDRVTRMFAGAGYAPQGALEAQGLHHLYRTRCAAGRCLSCAVGKWALGR